MRPRSRHIIVFNLAAGFLSLALISCQTGPGHSSQDNAEAKPAPLVDEKYSLTADRKQFDELRKDIPAQKRKENDELALISSLFDDESKTPSQVRDKFDSVLRKKRELFQKDMNRLRETYTNDERKRRESFTKQQDHDRAEFQKRKVSAAERTEFFNELETKRKDFYADERSKRDEFEETMRNDRKNFDDYTWEKSNEFNQELRAYSRKHEK